MRIGIHFPGPWWPTGYGVQGALFAPLIAGLGHQVALSVMHRHPGQRDQWGGLPVVGPAAVEYTVPAADLKAALGGDPDLLIVIKDPWVLPPRQLRRWKTAVWANIDCEPMGRPDLDFFRASGAIPLATSKFGLAQMRKAGLDPVYIPHGIDLGAWQPHQGGTAAARDELGLPRDHFVAGINAVNADLRKGWFEQLRAFASFYHRLQPRSLLLCHTDPDAKDGSPLRGLVEDLGLADCVRFGSHNRMTGEQMTSWYQALDVLMCCTYGEGFGLPVVEAIACGVPVIGTDCSAITEKIPAGAGWLVSGQEFWNPQFRACWTAPRIGEITAKLAHAHTRQLTVPRQYAAPYDAGFITANHWKPFLEEMTP
jgi:glycosyltransferase involved in cell wall biosynthesis